MPPPDTATTPPQTQHLHITVAAAAAGLACVLARPGVAEAGIAAAIIVLVRVAIHDQATHRIPNRLVAAAALALATTAVASGAPAITHVATVGGAWLTLLLVLHLVDTTLGFGDVKLGAVLGGLLGLAGHVADLSVMTSLLASSAAFIIGAGITLASQHKNATAPTPFAPGLVFAVSTTALLLLVGPTLS